MSSTDSTDTEPLFEDNEFVELTQNELRHSELFQWEEPAVLPAVLPPAPQAEIAPDLVDFGSSLCNSPSPGAQQAASVLQPVQRPAPAMTPAQALTQAQAPAPVPAPVGPWSTDRNNLRTAASTQYVLPHAPPPAPQPANPVTSPVQPYGDRFVEAAVNNAIPALERWPGAHQFRVTVRTPPPAQHGRQQPYVFDPEALKLYVDMGIAVPFAFRVAEGVDAGRLRVAALPVYPEMHHVNTPVRRCPTHRQPGLEFNAAAEGHVDHVIRAVHENAVYREAGTTKERRSVVVPYERPQPGTEEFKVLYNFGCMNTCVGGINRRRLMILFTLEDSSTGEPLGRQTIEVKVCKCPHRDFRTDQTRRRPGQLPPPKPSKRRLDAAPEPAGNAARRPRAGQQFVLMVDDQDLYDHLVAVRDSYLAIRRREAARAVAAAAAAEAAEAEEAEDTVENAPVDVAPTDLHRRPTLPPIKMELL